MVKIIDEKRSQLVRLCGQLGVKRFEVFGSAAQQEGFTAQSDLDFLVEFLPMTPENHSDAYFDLLYALRELFQRPVDLLEVNAIRNPYLMESINHHRVELYAA